MDGDAEYTSRVDELLRHGHVLAARLRISRRVVVRKDYGGGIGEDRGLEDEAWLHNARVDPAYAHRHKACDAHRCVEEHNDELFAVAVCEVGRKKREEGLRGAPLNQVLEGEDRLSHKAGGVERESREDVRLVGGASLLPSHALISLSGHVRRGSLARLVPGGLLARSVFFLFEPFLDEERGLVDAKPLHRGHEVEHVAFGAAAEAAEPPQRRRDFEGGAFGAGLVNGTGAFELAACDLAHLAEKTVAPERVGEGETALERHEVDEGRHGLHRVG